MNLVADIKTYITTQLTSLFAPMTIDNFGSASEALMIRGDPSQATIAEYVDGSTTGTQQVSFYARSKNPATAIGALDSIQAKFNEPKIALTGAVCISVRAATLPAFVNKEETGESIYTMTVNVDFDGQNPIGV